MTTSISENGPPANLKPAELVAQLRQRPRPSMPMDFPGYQYEGTPLEKIRIVVQPSNANGQAQLAAHARMRDEMKLPLIEWETETGKAILGDLVAKEMIARMVFMDVEISPGKYQAIFTDSKSVEQLCSADEVAVLFDLCMDVQRQLGPRLHVLTEADIDSWINILGEGLRSDMLCFLALQDARELCLGLARRLAKSTKSQAQDSQPSESRRSSESTQTTSATDTTYSTEPRSNIVAGTTLTDDEARAIARQMLNRKQPLE